MCHVTGSVLGGAGTGAVIGALGGMLRLPRVSPWLVGAAVLAAAWLGIRPRPRSLGLQRQVPRRWRPGIPVGVIYFLWGLMLGTGILTVIPHSAFLVMTAAEAVSGPLAAAAAGGAFGVGRSLAAVAQGIREADPQRTMDLLPRLGPAAQKVNIIAVAVGGSLIMSGLLIRP